MPAATKPKKEYALVDMNKKCLVLKGGKPVLHVGAQPPLSDDYPKRYSKGAGFSFESVELEQSPHHVGEPKYDLPDNQKAIVRKTISTQEKK
jgi:hypothetical protein